MQPDSLIKNSLIGLAALLLLGVGALLLYSFDPSAPNNYFPRCPSYWLLGVYCPGCGITRALHALLHGDVVQAFAHASGPTPAAQARHFDDKAALLAALRAALPGMGSVLVKGSRFMKMEDAVQALQEATCS